MTWRSLLPAACLVFCTVLPAASLQDTVLRTTVTFNPTAYGDAAFAVVSTGLPIGAYSNPSLYCGQPGQPACIVDIISSPGCGMGTQCGLFNFAGSTASSISVAAEFGNTFQSWLFSGSSGTITAPGIYPITGSLEYSDPLQNITIGIGGQVEVSVAAAPEPVSWLLLAIGLAGIALARRRSFQN